MQQLKQFYISPLSKMYFERIAMEKIIFGVPLFVRISDPESWLVKEAYQRLKELSAEKFEKRVKNLARYLNNVPEGSVFDGDRVLTLNESIPYIEWRCRSELVASTDLLGKYVVFIDAMEFDDDFEDLSKIINGLQSSFGECVQLVLIGQNKLQALFEHYSNLVFIDPEQTTHLSFSERFKFRNKNGLTLFNFGSRPYFLIGPHGQLMTFFSKQDYQALIDEMKKYIQIDK